MLLSPLVAREFIHAARLANRPILGVDSFVVTDSATMSSVEGILDLGGADPSVDTWQTADQFIKERADLGFMFEVIV